MALPSDNLAVPKRSLGNQIWYCWEFPPAAGDASWSVISPPVTGEYGVSIAFPSAFSLVWSKTDDGIGCRRWVRPYINNSGKIRTRIQNRIEKKTLNRAESQPGKSSHATTSFPLRKTVARARVNMTSPAYRLVMALMILSSRAPYRTDGASTKEGRAVQTTFLRNVNLFWPFFVGVELIKNMWCKYSFFVTTRFLITTSGELVGRTRQGWEWNTKAKARSQSKPPIKRTKKWQSERIGSGGSAKSEVMDEDIYHFFSDCDEIGCGPRTEEMHMAINTLFTGFFFSGSQTGLWRSPSLEKK